MADMIRFTSKEEFNEHYKKMAKENEDEFNDDLCVKGNSYKTLGWLRGIAEKIGYDNILVENRDDCSTHIHLDVSKNPKAYIDIYADEVEYNNGIIQMWFD